MADVPISEVEPGDGRHRRSGRCLHVIGVRQAPGHRRRIRAWLGVVSVLAGMPVGIRAQCLDSGGCDAYAFDAVYTGETWRNTTGGLRTGGVYLENLDMALTVDGGLAFGADGLTLFAYGLYNNDAELTGRYIGDKHVVSNIETGLQAARLYEAWAGWVFGDEKRHSLRLGLYDLNSEFDAIETSALFINSGRGIGPEFAQAGRNGPSIFPSTSLAVRWRFRPLQSWTLKFAALDGVPGDPEEPGDTTIDLGSEDGALLVGEVNYSGGPIRKAGLGYWHFTADFDDVLATTPGGEPVERSGNSGMYGFVDTNLYNEADDPGQGLTGWIRYGVADDDVNPLRSYGGFGLVYTGLVPGRPVDQFGIALSVARNGDPFMAAAGAGMPLDRRETNVELTYRARLADWLVLQPNIQYVKNPGTDPSLDDALVAGLRFEVSWGVTW